MNGKVIHSIQINSKSKRVLFVPDSIWGELSGHRSSKYLVKVFSKSNNEIAVYAPKENHTKEQQDKLGKNIRYYEQTKYTYWQNLFPFTVAKEFIGVIEEFKPDFVFYMGTIKNKVSIDICIKKGIKYSYLPLTTEYYCIKDFAALPDGPCFQCIKSPFINSIKNKCLGSDTSSLVYLKESFFTYISRKRVLKANKVVGYSDNQLKYLSEYGVDQGQTIKMPIFFDPNTVSNIRTSIGDYFVMAGQNITGKGWHVIPEIIKAAKGIKYKLLMKSEKEANKFIEKNGLQDYVNRGEIEIILYLNTHNEILELMANARGILVPSYYATTGEFYFLEALGLGKPVILFDVGIHSDVIRNGENAMISKIGDIQNFSKNIERVNNENKLYSKLSCGAKNLFTELLSYKKFEESLNDYFT